MASLKVSLFCMLSCLQIFHVRTDDTNFTKIGHMSERAFPFKFNGELYFRIDESVFPIERSYQKCRFPHLDIGLRTFSILGNNKLLVIGETVTHFDVLDLTNCSSPKVTFISDGDNYFDKFYRSDIKLKSVVTYEDTFDVFDYYQTTCMPCRYNDKGEKLPTEFSLEKEPTGVDPRWTHQHDGYSLELVNDAFGVVKGYLYLFNYVNGTSVLKLLDSRFKLVKQRLFNETIEAHSLLDINITVCYKLEAFPRPYRGFCFYVKCHLLDPNFNSTTEVELHRVMSHAYDNKISVDMKVRNLPGGGAMVALRFHHDRSQSVHRKDVFLQRIHPNGQVDPPIQFDIISNDFVFMYDFLLDSGEYCLVTVNDYYVKGSHTLVKCLIPSPPKIR